MLSCPTPHVSRIIAVANQKGVVGKAPPSIVSGRQPRAADAGARGGRRSPGNLSSGLGCKAAGPSPSLYARDRPAATGRHPAPTDLEHLTLAPADRNLTGAEVELVPLLARGTG